LDPGDGFIAGDRDIPVFNDRTKLSQAKSFLQNKRQTFDKAALWRDKAGSVFKHHFRKSSFKFS